MRLRHIKGSENFIREASECITGDVAVRMRGHIQEIFPYMAPVQIEIGMGKGQFIRNMALKHPDINFLGIERYESVMMKAIQRKRLMEEEMPINNLKFLCADAGALAGIFEMGEVDKIFLNFSDPWPKERHANRRLTSSKFLNIYDKILKKGGVIEFKTDNIGLFEFSLETIKKSKWQIIYSSFDFHSDAESAGNVMTEYEEKFSNAGNKICKLTATR